MTGAASPLRDCLAGRRVLDLSQYLPGPFASLMLADLGADVVKVEPPAGDPMRDFGPAGPGGPSLWYQTLNGGKTVVRLDLKDAEDQTRLAELLADCDVLVESFRPGVLARLGFPAERLAEINQGLVHCALSGFGQTGPLAQASGHDITYLAMTGALHATGEPDRPSIPFPPMADHAGAWAAVSAILAALLRRAATGAGAHLDVSLFEGALAQQYYGLSAALQGEQPVDRGTTLVTGAAAFYRIYRTADGRFAAFAPIEGKFWERFCAAVERPDLLPRHAEPLPQTALIAELESLFESRPLADWEALLGPRDCCFQPVLTHGEALAVPHVAGRGLVQRDGPSGPVHTLFPALMDGTPAAPRQPVREATPAEAVAAWEAGAQPS